MGQAVKLVNYQEPAIIAGTQKTKLYTELNSDVLIGDKIFIVGGNYDNYTQGGTVTTFDPYAPYVDGYRVLDINKNTNAITIDYNFDPTKTVFSTTKINGNKEAYLSKAYFKAGQFNNGLYGEGIFGSTKTTETTTLNNSIEFKVIGGNYIVIPTALFLNLNNGDTSTSVKNYDKLIINNAFNNTTDNDKLYTVLEVITPNNFPITNAVEYAFRVLETVSVGVYSYDIQIQRSNAAVFGNKMFGNPKIKQTVWLGGNWKKGTLESKTDNFDASYNFVKTEYTNVLSTSILTGANANNFGLGFNYFESCVWNNGVWNNGVWNRGYWINGTFDKGEFGGGIIENCIKNNGRFWSNNTYLKWLNGTHNNGTMEDCYWEKGIWNNGVWYGNKNIKVLNYRLDTGILKIEVDRKYLKRFSKADKMILPAYGRMDTSYNNYDGLNYNPNGIRHLTDLITPVDYTTNEIITQTSAVSLGISDYTNANISDAHFKYGIWQQGDWKSGYFWGGYTITSVDDTVSGQLSFQVTTNNSIPSVTTIPNKVYFEIGDIIYLSNYKYTYLGVDYDLYNIPLTITNKVNNNITDPCTITVSITPNALNSTSLINNLINVDAFATSNRWLDGNFYSGNIINSSFEKGNVYAQYENISDLYLAHFENATWVRNASITTGPNSTWYNGLWHFGTVINGDWMNGRWLNGYWLATYTQFPIAPNQQYSAIWYNGIWERGNWYTGLWKDGVHNGTPVNSRWESGTTLQNIPLNFINSESLSITTSATGSNYISLGQKYFTVDKNLDFLPGDIVTISGYGTNNSNNMTATVISYTYKTLLLNITSINIGILYVYGLFENFNITYNRRTFVFTGTPATFWKIGLQFSLSGTVSDNGVGYIVRNINTNLGNTYISVQTITNFYVNPLENSASTVSYISDSINIWEKGIWNNGLWIDGIFMNGDFNAGVWLNGTWLNGNFNSGNFNSGNFMNGYIGPTTNFYGSQYGGNNYGILQLGSIMYSGNFYNNIVNGIVEGGNLFGANFGATGVMYGGNANASIFSFGTLNGGTVDAGSLMDTNATINDGIVKNSTLKMNTTNGGYFENNNFTIGNIDRGEWQSGILSGGNIIPSIKSYDANVFAQDQSRGLTEIVMAKCGTAPFVGDFTSGAGWTLGPNITIASGVARFNRSGSGSSTMQRTTGPMIPGLRYLISFKIVSTNINSTLNVSLNTVLLGNLDIKIYGGAISNSVNTFSTLVLNSVGVYSGILEADGSDFKIEFNYVAPIISPLLACDISIDDVICRPIIGVPFLPLFSYGDRVWLNNIRTSSLPLTQKYFVTEADNNVFSGGFIKIHIDNNFNNLTTRYTSPIYPVSTSVWNGGNMTAGTFSSIWRNGVIDNETSLMSSAIFEAGSIGRLVTDPTTVIGGELILDGEFNLGGTYWDNLSVPAYNFSNNANLNLPNNIPAVGAVTLPQQNDINVTFPTRIFNVGPGLVVPIGTPVKVIMASNPSIFMSGYVISYVSPNITILVNAKSGMSGITYSNWIVEFTHFYDSPISPVITAKNAFLSTNILTPGAYYKTSLYYNNNEPKNFARIQLGSFDYAVNSRNTDFTIIGKANGTTFNLNNVTQFPGSNNFDRISVKRITMPVINTTLLFSSVINMVDMSSSTFYGSTHTINNGLFNLITTVNGGITINNGRFLDSVLLGVQINDGYFKSTNLTETQLTNSTFNQGVFERGRTTCSTFNRGLIVEALISDGLFQYFNNSEGLDTIKLLYEKGAYALRKKACIQLINNNATASDVVGTQLNFFVNGSLLFTLTASVNYNANAYPALAYSTANWQTALGTLPDVTLRRPGAAWNTDNYRLIVRDIVEKKLIDSGLFPNGINVYFGNNFPDAVITNFGKNATEVGATINTFYIEANDYNTTNFNFTANINFSDYSVNKNTNKIPAINFWRNRTGSITNLIANNPNSNTNVLVSTGSKTFSIVGYGGEGFNNFQKSIVKIYSKSAPSNYMVGHLTSASISSLVVQVQATSGSGAFNDWIIEIYKSPNTSTSCAGFGGGGGPPLA